MKLILHHLRKDIRAQRWLLLLWALVLLIPIILNILVFQPDYDTAKYIEALRNSPLRMLLNVVVWTILVARLIQSEPVTGSTSFWLTRPIPSAVYIPSKLIFLAGLILAPSLLSDVICWTQLQLSAETIRSGLASLIILQVIGGICVIWLTTYTPSLLHFAGIFCLGVLSLFLFIVLGVSLHSSHMTNRSLTMDYFFDILVPGLFLSLVVQHWQRRGRMGLVLGIATVVIAAIAQMFSPGAPVPARAELVATGKPVHIDMSPDWQKRILWSHRTADTLWAMAYLTPAANDRDLALNVRSSAGEFQVAGESPTRLSLLQDALPNSLWQMREDPLELVRKALPGYSCNWNDQAQHQQQPFGLFTLDSALKGKLQGKTGTLVLHLEGQFFSLLRQAEIPLDQPHFIARIPGGFIRVQPLNSRDDSDLVVWKAAAEKIIYWNSADMIYVLADPQNQVALLLNPGGSSSSSATFGGSGLQMTDSETHLDAKGNKSLDRMVLYVFQITPGDSFESTLTAPNFTMNPK